MTGTRGIGRRRGTRGKTVLVDGIPEGVTMNTEPAYTPTQVIPAVTPTLAQDMADGLANADLREFAAALGDEPHAPIPDLYSADPADRTAYLDALGGDESTFRATVADLNAMWLLDTSLPVPARTAEDAAEAPADSGPGTPPAGEVVAPAAATPPVPGPVSTEEEPVQDEPDAEADCAEGGETA